MRAYSKLAGCLVLMTASIPCFAVDLKESDWKTGTLMEVWSEQGSRVIGTANRGDAVLVDRGETTTYYKIDAGEVLYVAKHTYARKDEAPLNLAVNAPVKFAVQGHDLYLMDENGKPHKLRIEKKTPKKAGA